MGDVVNLRRVRKSANRQRAASQSATNRLLHGHNKAERNMDVARSAKAERELDGHRIESGEER